MKTLKDIIINSKCRKGKEAEITNCGAYWLAAPPIIIRRYGGDGIGRDEADRTNTLELRHYRDGDVHVVVRERSRHQNEYNKDNILQTTADTATTAEGVVTILKGLIIRDGPALSDYHEDNLCECLETLGLAPAAASPDDEPLVTK